MLIDLRVSPSGVLTGLYPCQDRLSVAKSATRLKTGRIVVDVFISSAQNSNCPACASRDTELRWRMMLSSRNQLLPVCSLSPRSVLITPPPPPGVNPDA